MGIYAGWSVAETISSDDWREVADLINAMGTLPRKVKVTTQMAVDAHELAVVSKRGRLRTRTQWLWPAVADAERLPAYRPTSSCRTWKSAHTSRSCGTS